MLADSERAQAMRHASAVGYLTRSVPAADLIPAIRVGTTPARAG